MALPMPSTSSVRPYNGLCRRARHLGDDDFVEVPIKGLISKTYAQNLRQRIDPKKAKSFQESHKRTPFPKESDETTHFTIVDQSGWTVSSTQTINGWLGSGFVVPKTGIILNNEMDDFAQKVGASNLFGAIGGANNLIEPKKRPLSSMSPTLILKDGQIKLALGTPSGTRILTCVCPNYPQLFNFLKWTSTKRSQLRVFTINGHRTKLELVATLSPPLSFQSLKGEATKLISNPSAAKFGHCQRGWEAHWSLRSSRAGLSLGE